MHGILLAAASSWPERNESFRMLAKNFMPTLGQQRQTPFILG
jgi:hypothetical protein